MLLVGVQVMYATLDKIDKTKQTLNYYMFSCLFCG